MGIIKIPKIFHVSFPVVVIVFLAYLCGVWPYLLCLYTAVFLHEMAHLAVCLALRERVIGVYFTAYGMNLRTAYIKSPKNQILVSAAGPLMNVALMEFCLLIKPCWLFSYLDFFILSNLLIFLLNLCPALPLDGGVMARAGLLYFFGYFKSHRMMLSATRIVGVLFLLFGLVFLLVSKFNISLLVVGGFLLYNLRNEQRGFLQMQRMMLSKEFDRTGEVIRVKNIGVMRHVTARYLMKYFGYNFICVAAVFDENMVKLGELSQQQLIDGLLQYGPDVTVGRLVEG